MNQARGVLALQLAREACFERTGELPRELRTVLSLEAMGESMCRRHDTRSPIEREASRLFRTTFEGAVAILKQPLERTTLRPGARYVA
jgi:hypothetical protein